jgi:two-component system chemotaxis sensor kinase CheA
MELRLDATPEELPIFVAEVDEILLNLDEQLVRLEQDGPSPELLQEVFRAAHTIKGSSAAIGHLRMAGLTHAMETLLDKLRKNEMDVSPELVDRLFQGLDMLKVLAAEVETLEQGHFEQDDFDVDGLVEALEALAHGAAADRPAQGERGTVRPSTLDAPDGSTHHLLVELEAGSWGAVRALQVVLAIEQLGELRLSQPSRSDIEQQKVERRVEAFIESDCSGHRDSRGAERGSRGRDPEPG